MTIDHAVPLSSSHAVPQSQELSDKKYKMKLARLLVKTDFKHPKIWPELKETKESLLKNVRGNVVPLSEVNHIFRIYAGIKKDIPVHNLLKKQLHKFVVDVRGEKISVIDYLDILHGIRGVFAPIKANYDHIKNIARKCLIDKTKDIHYTELDYENYKTNFREQIDELHQRTYTDTYLKDIEKDLLIQLSNGEVDFYAIVQYVVLHSYSPSQQEKSHITEFFKPYLSLSSDNATIVPLTIKTFLNILSELSLSQNIFSKL